MGAPPYTDAVLYVDGQQRGFRVASLSVVDRAQERSALKATIVDEAEVVVVRYGQQVHLYAENEDHETVLVFGGTVAKATRSAISTRDGGGIDITIDVADWHSLLDGRRHAEAYEGVTAGSVVLDVLADVGRDENVYAHPYPGTVVAEARTDLLGYWRLADGPADDSWALRDGTDVGTPVYSGAGVGSPVGDTHLGGFVTLDGANYIDLPDSASVIGGSWTIAGWTRKAAGDFQSMWGDGIEADYANANTMFIDVLSVADDIRVFVNGATRLATGRVAMSENQWHHVAVTYDHDTGTLAAFVDGVKVAQASYAIVPWESDWVTIGVRPTGTGFYPGDMAEVQTVGRALTAAEVATLHAQSGQAIRVSDGPTIERVTVAYAEAAEVVGELAELAGYEWHIDPHRTLHFHGRAAACCAVPGGTVDTSVMLADSVDHTFAAPTYRNRQFVRGGRDRTTEQVETTIMDGEERQVTVGFPIVEVPTVEVETGVATNVWVTQDMGIKGVTVGADWYWSKGDATIVQEQTDPPVADGVRVRVTYVGEFSIVVVAGDLAESIDYRTLSKHGSGWVDGLADDPTVESREQGFQKAGALLEKHKDRADDVAFTSRHAGWRAGQTGPLVIARFGVDTQVLIEEVELFDTGTELRWKVKAVSGPVVESWVAMLARGIRAPSVIVPQVNIGRDEIVTILADGGNETHTLTEVGTAPVALSCPIVPFNVPEVVC